MVKARTGQRSHPCHRCRGFPALRADPRQIAPKLVVNLALPYQDLAIMDACLATGVHYMDTANYEPKDEAKFEYKWQWAYHDRFREKGLMALLGSGFDPGVTSVFAMWLKKHKLKTIRLLDILDCNGGDLASISPPTGPKSISRSDRSGAPLERRLGGNPGNDDPQTLISRASAEEHVSDVSRELKAWQFVPEEKARLMTSATVYHPPCCRTWA
jgi:hypothetical protein